MKPGGFEARFWAKVKKSEGCWEWTASKINGYGQFMVSPGERWSAHRLSWVFHYGPIPQGTGYHGTCVLHRCDNPACVRPDHLFLGSNADNVRDMVSKGRNSLKRMTGEAHGMAKLTEADVVAIRNDQRNRRVLAKEYGVHPNTIYNVRQRIKWKSVAA